MSDEAGGPWASAVSLIRALGFRAKFDDARLSRIEDRLAALDGGPSSIECRRDIPPLFDPGNAAQ